MGAILNASSLVNISWFKVINIFWGIAYVGNPQCFIERPGSGDRLEPNRQQAITWTHNDWVLHFHIALPSQNDSKWRTR